VGAENLSSLAEASANPVPSKSAQTNVPLATAMPWTVCGISRSQWHRLYSAGRTPLAIRLGQRRPVFLIAELELWLRHGAPPRDRWEQIKEMEMKR
jgi:predicted DNA-binding transcriptional regulator AlpA